MYKPIMMFGEYPQAFLPQLFVECIVVLGIKLGEMGQRFDDNKSDIRHNFTENFTENLSKTQIKIRIHSEKINNFKFFGIEIFR